MRQPSPAAVRERIAKAALSESESYGRSTFGQCKEDLSFRQRRREEKEESYWKRKRKRKGETDNFKSYKTYKRSRSRSREEEGYCFCKFSNILVFSLLFYLS